MAWNPSWRHMQNMARGSSEDDSEGVSLHRSYGMTKRVYPLWERIKLTFFQGLVVWMVIPWVFVTLTLYIVFLAFYPEMWFKIFVSILLWGLLIFRLTRTLRKRRKFTRKFKRVCKKKGFRIHYEQNFFQSLVWSPDKQDFVVETKEKAYYVRYLTINKYRSTLFLESANLLRLVKAPPVWIFLRIFDVSAKIKQYPMEFQIPEREDGRASEKVLVINPVCEEIRVKQANGGYESTGDGGTQFGYTVHTGTGFLDALEREE